MREAYAHDLVEDGEGWMAMLVDWIRTSRAYDQATAQATLENIDATCHQLFDALDQKSLRSLSAVDGCSSVYLWAARLSTRSNKSDLCCSPSR